MDGEHPGKAINIYKPGAVSKFTYESLTPHMEDFQKLQRKERGPSLGSNSAHFLHAVYLRRETNFP